MGNTPARSCWRTTVHYRCTWHPNKWCTRASAAAHYGFWTCFRFPIVYSFITRFWKDPRAHPCFFRTYEYCLRNSCLSLAPAIHPATLSHEWESSIAVLRVESQVYTMRICAALRGHIFRRVVCFVSPTRLARPIVATGIFLVPLIIFRLRKIDSRIELTWRNGTGQQCGVLLLFFTCSLQHTLFQSSH